MKNLWPVCLFLGLTLTSCPQPGPPPVLAVPSDPAVLNGHWQGTAEQLTSGNIYSRGPDVVYRAIFEARLPDTNNHYRPSLLVQRLGTGEVLNRLQLLRSPDALGYRSATATTPARLLVFYPAALSDGVKLNSIEERDPDTLAVMNEWSYVANAPLTGTSWATFSLDGMVFSGADGRLINTVTHEFLPLNATVSQQMSNPPQPNGKLQWSPDMTWLEVDTYVPALFGGEYRYDYLSNTTGSKISGAPLHTVGCNLNGSANSWAQQIVSLPDGGAALSFPDGWLELRNADNTLRKAIHLGDCALNTFIGTGEVLSIENYLGKSATIRQSDGQVLPGPAATSAMPSLNISLNTQARFLTENTYESAGTATVNGQSYVFKATATGLEITFKAQTSPIPQEVQWTGELRRQDGTLFAKAFGGHRTTPETQWLHLELADVDMGFSFSGALKR